MISAARGPGFRGPRVGVRGEITQHRKTHSEGLRGLGSPRFILVQNTETHVQCTTGSSARPGSEAAWEAAGE